MPRTKAVLGSGVRLTDFLGASLLARVYPLEIIQEALKQHAVASQRVRSLPMPTMVYYCIALSLYPESAYEAVYESLCEGLQFAQINGSRGSSVPEAPLGVSKSSVSAARAKLGFEALASLHQRLCVPLADAKTQPEAFYAGFRVVALDGSNFELPDEADNVNAFGRPGSRTGVAAYPQAQCAILVECATHAILAAQIGKYRDSEWGLCKPLLPKLEATMLCLADRGFDGAPQWLAARATGAHLLWRVKGNRVLPVLKALPDGSYLSAIYPTQDGKHKEGKEGKKLCVRNKNLPKSADGISVRVIEYSLPQSALGGNDRGNATGSSFGKKDGKPGGKKRAAPVSRYRLITSLLDPAVAPALELARLYHERWEIEGVFDELKTHLVQSRRCFRSKTADGVRQEFYGWILAHYAVCWLMHKAASAHRIALRKLSFTGNLQLLRKVQPHSGAFPPSAPEASRAPP